MNESWPNPFDTARIYREHSQRRQMVASALSARWPALYAFWARVQQETHETVGLARGSVEEVQGATVEGLAHACGYPASRVARFVEAFERLVSAALDDPRVWRRFEGQRVEEDLHRRATADPLPYKRRRRPATMEVVVETAEAVATRDREEHVTLNTWDAAYYW